MGKIRIAIVGVGNCAASLIQGMEYYRQNGAARNGVRTWLADPDLLDTHGVIKSLRAQTFMVKYWLQ